VAATTVLGSSRQDHNPPLQHFDWRALSTARKTVSLGAPRCPVLEAVAAHPYARVSFLSPDERGVLCGWHDVGHVFSLSSSRTGEPHGL
jgi:hypothetical protein